MSEAHDKERFWCPNCVCFVSLNTNGRCEHCSSDGVVSEHSFLAALTSLQNKVSRPVRPASQARSAALDNESTKQPIPLGNSLSLREAMLRVECNAQDAEHKQLELRCEQEANAIKALLVKHGYASVAEWWDGSLWSWHTPHANNIAERMTNVASGTLACFVTPLEVQLTLTNKDFDEVTMKLRYNSVVVEKGGDT